MKLLGSALWLCAVLSACSAKVAPKVKCTPTQMRVEVPISSTTKGVYIEGLRDYPDPACRPHTDPTGTLAVLELDLQNVYRCAVTRVVNKQTGKQIYYQTLVIENMEEEDGRKHEVRETLHVKCSILSLRNHTISKRNVLPAGFREPEEIEIMITNSTTGRAPEPILGVGVRQDGKLVTGELNVSPGTPLQMEIYLDKVSAPIYGLLVTHMQVTDTKDQEETIIYNGCSVDPYLFENFNTVDGDFLAAKFRAFKFPESTYVQFRGTVNVCLDKCKGVECSDGQIGYGRRRRSIPVLPADPNRIFEITITSFIKVGANGTQEIHRKEEKVHSSDKFDTGLQMSDLKDKTFYQTDSPPREVMELVEEKQYTAIFADESQSSATSSIVGIVFLLSLFNLFL